jgi:multiple sugar transport system substrate-binding protein
LVGDGGVDRREFLRLAAGGAVCAAAAGAGCSSGSSGGKASAKVGATDDARSGATPKQLRIAQVIHYVPAYDTWFDNEYIRAWGERNGVQIIVDHINVLELPARAAAEASIRQGHDLFAFLSPPAAFEDDAVDLRDVVEEVEAKVGKPVPLAERSGFNPKTKKWFAFPDHWGAQVVSYRTDFWAGLGKNGRPDSWDDLLMAGPKLKAAGHPLGIDMSQNLDGNLNLIALLFAYGAALQTADGVPALNSPATVAAVRAASALWSGGQAPDTLTWNDAAANNRHLTGGKGSLILNPVSALRAVEKQDPAMAGNIGLGPALAGPAARLAPSFQSLYVLWNFAKNQETAKRFLIDLALASRDIFLHSEFYNLPSFPGAIADLADLVAKAPAVPAGKYALLAHAPEWTTNLGHPGPSNAAVDEVYNKYVIPRMVAAVARGEQKAEAAVAAASAELTTIYDKWRERGKI